MHATRTSAHSAGQSSDQKKSSRVSRKLAQLASEAFSAGRPKRSQLLRSSTFQAGSDVGDEGPLCMMARRMACCACCRANLNLVGGWTYVVPRRSLISVHEIVLNDYRHGEGPSPCQTTCLRPQGVSVELSSCGSWMVRTTSTSATALVSKTNDGFSRFSVCGGLRYQLVVGLEAPCYALGVYVGSLRASVRPLLQSRFA